MMVFRTKKAEKGSRTSAAEEAPRETTRALLPHNSMVKMGLVTNMRWLHAIRQDKRLKSAKTAEELAFEGGRISLTFRKIATFLSKDHTKIWGQGAYCKAKENACTVINGGTKQGEAMIRAFGKENHASEFDWAETYGEGFDVLHMSNSRKLFLSGDEVSDMRAKLALAYYGISWTEAFLSPEFNYQDDPQSMYFPENSLVKFIDNDLFRSTVIGDVAIMNYIDAVHSSQNANSVPRLQQDLAHQFTRLQQANALLSLLKKYRLEPFNVLVFHRELLVWEGIAAESDFIAGGMVSIADFAFWPVLNEIRGEQRDFEGLEHLAHYYDRMKGMQFVKKALGAGKEKEVVVLERAA